MALSFVVSFLIARFNELLWFAFGFLCLCLIAAFAADLIYLGSLLLRGPWKAKNEFVLTHHPLTVAFSSVAGPMLVLTTINYLCIWWIRITWWWYLPYLGYSLLSNEGSVGGRHWDWLRTQPIWERVVNYYPIRLHKHHENIEYKNDKSYLFGYHPHGIFSIGAVAAFSMPAAGLDKILPGMTPYICTLNLSFRIPFFREWIMALRCISVAKESIDYVLKKGGGHGVLVVVGGGQEAIRAKPKQHDLVLMKRKGFVRAAFRNGSYLVPVFCFGENELYELCNWTHIPVMNTVSKLTKRFFGFTLPKFNGRGLFQKSSGIFAMPAPLNIVFGDPIECPKKEEPTDEEVEKIHAMYMASLQSIFDSMKHQFCEDPERETLRFIR